MNIQETLQAVASPVSFASSPQTPNIGAESIVGHTFTAATLGTGLSAVLTWGLQLAHVDPPVAVAQFFSALCMVAASWTMAKLGKV